MSEPNLLPCPFCGAEPELYERDSGYSTGWDVQCNTKGCYLEFGGDYWLAKEEEAIALWNNRPTMRATDAEDSASSQTESNAETLSTSDGSAVPARRS